MRLLISGSWVRAPSWAFARFCDLFQSTLSFYCLALNLFLKVQFGVKVFSERFLAQKSKEISVTISGKHIAPKLNLEKAMWTEKFNNSWCLTQTVVAKVFFVLYSRLVGDKVWSMGINCLIET